MTAIPHQTPPAEDPPGPHARAHRFVAQVRTLCKDDPGKRAALRSGLGRPVDDCARMHWVIADLVPVPDRHYDSTERAYYAIAAMIASVPGPVSAPAHPAQTSAMPGTARRNLGECLAQAVEAGLMRESSAESRLRLLTKQSVGGLHRHLPSTVRILAGRPEGVDWAQLLVDLTFWERDRPCITRRWLQAFYRTRLRRDQHSADAADREEHSAAAPAAQ
ncbi:type I-E CRISPR-associated protein Cse2/CasB [Streptomyces sp. NPDC051636]|uniref:type I-E CRISPR-associated protein Cse2/CasB n=1 Tax=Streptomyces sp. NPDC051636 TaxID=3365663 RepID=UPI0037B2AD7D